MIRDYFAEKKQIRDETARLRTEIEEERAETEKENARQREDLEKTLEKFRSDILLKVVLEKAKRR